jgi:hypothetical protein
MEKQIVIQALESQCRSWLAARMRLSDVDQCEWHSQFMQNWREAASGALSTWQERAAKLFESFELQLYEKPWPKKASHERGLPKLLISRFADL